MHTIRNVTLAITCMSSKKIMEEHLKEEVHIFLLVFFCNSIGIRWCKIRWVHTCAAVSTKIIIIGFLDSIQEGIFQMTEKEAPPFSKLSFISTDFEVTREILKKKYRKMVKICIKITKFSQNSHRLQKFIPTKYKFGNWRLQKFFQCC